MSGEIQVKSANFVDEKILSLAGAYSPTEISDMMAGRVSPEEVHDRGKALLKRDWLTLAEEDQLVVRKLNKILIRLEGQYLNLDNASTQLKLLKEIGARLDKRAAATTVDLTALYGNQAILMGQAIELALQKTLGVLRKAHPELEESEIREALRLSLPEAAAEIQSRTVDG